MDSNEPCFLGVDQQVLEEFLVLVRDNYELADQAYFFLEHHVGVSGTNVSITNLRDVLSHLTSLLQEGHLPPDKQREQVAGATEHIRRAIIEPYEDAVNIKTLQVKRCFTLYKIFVFPLCFILFTSAPTLDQINAQLTAIGDIRSDARKAKGLNRLTDEWRQGITLYVRAFDELDSIARQLEGYNIKGIGIIGAIAGVLALAFTL